MDDGKVLRPEDYWHAIATTFDPSISTKPKETREIDVRELSDADKYLALERAQKVFSLYPVAEGKNVEDILGYDFPPDRDFRDFAKERLSVKAAQEFYVQHGIQDASREIKLTSLMYHIGIENIGDLLYPYRQDTLGILRTLESAAFFNHGIVPPA